MAHKDGDTGYLSVTGFLEGLACLVLHVRVKNQLFWGLACLVTYVLVNSYSIVVFFFLFFMYIYLLEIV